MKRKLVKALVALGSVTALAFTLGACSNGEEPAEGTLQITSFTIVTDGSTNADWSSKESPELAKMNGKTLADIQAILAEEANRGEGEKLHTGATNSNLECFNAAAFTLANYDACLNATTVGESFKYTDYVNTAETSWTKSGSELTFSIVTVGTEKGRPSPFTLTIKVNKV